MDTGGYDRKNGNVSLPKNQSVNAIASIPFYAKCCNLYRVEQFEDGGGTTVRFTDRITVGSLHPQHHERVT